MFKSIRSTLQLWHALLLLAVVCIFGTVLYSSVRHARLESVDVELRGSAEVLAARVHPVFRPRREDREAQPPPPPPQTEPARAELDPPRPALDPPQGPRPSPEPPRRERFRIGRLEDMDAARRDEFERSFEVPSDLQQRYEGAADAPYFVIWRSNGQLLTTSKDAPVVPAPTPRADARAPQPNSPPPNYRQRGIFREVVVPGPVGMQVLVGRSVAREAKELKQLAVLLGATGACVLAVGLAGGFLLSHRAVRPIKLITATARNISASNLSQRIKVEETESELGGLADVLNAMFARLEAAFERQVRFTADASHELRTPLSIIYSHAELAQSRPRTAEEYRDAIDTCFRASKRMKSLVDSLLVLARADAGKLQLNMEAVELSEVAQECLATVAPQAHERDVTLDSDLEELTVYADRTRISQLLTNLLSNAIRYNREGGRVRLSIAAEEGDAILTVSDTGVGISPQDQPHVFERFFRADKARSREAGGSGLGLAICKSIVEAHGGEIFFVSRPGEGTTFTVRLPMRVAQFAPGAATNQDKSASLDAART